MGLACTCKGGNDELEACSAGGQLKRMPPHFPLLHMIILQYNNTEAVVLYYVDESQSKNYPRCDHIV